jgi:MFS transporter, DHA1 family, inner membrane transport protein
MKRKESIWLQLPFIIGARTVINTMQRMVYPLLPVFGRGLGVDLTQLSWALSLRSATGLFGPFLAAVSDSRGRKVGMLLAMGLFTLGALVLVIWPGYPAFVLMLILSIMANFIFVPSVQAYLGDRVPYERRGLVIGLTELSWSISFIVGVPLVTWLIARGGWLAPFPWLGAAGLLSMALLGMVVPSDRPTPGHTPKLWHNLKQILAEPAARAGVVLAICLSGANELVNLPFGVWLEDAFQVKLAALAAASIVIGVSELCGEGVVTLFVDRLGKRRAVGLGLLLNALASLALPWLGGGLSAAVIGLFLIYFTFEFTMVSALPLMTEVMPAARATFMAAFIASTALGRSAGSLFALYLYRLGQGLENMPPVLITVVVAAAVDLAGLAALQYIHETIAVESPV